MPTFPFSAAIEKRVNSEKGEEAMDFLEEVFTVAIVSFTASLQL